MVLRTTPSSAAASAAAASMFILACSTSSPPASGDSTPDGSTPVTKTSLVGCSPLQPGCFTTGNLAYEPPSTLPACSQPGSPKLGAADTHCNGVPPQAVSAASCSLTTQKDAGPPNPGGVCGENGSDYGPTMYGLQGDDDDCKYRVTYSVGPICENDGFYFKVTANYLTRDGAPLTGACTWAELCLNDTHPAPTTDSRPPGGNQEVVEGPPGTYTIGPVQVDEPGDWTVRFHFNEICCDVAPDSPHGHAAFHLSVP